MPNWKNYQPSPATPDDPQHWLTAYFCTRAHLAASESEFHCNPTCTRPGCQSKNILVPVSLIDLMGLARHEQESVSAMYQRHCTLGLLPQAGHDGSRKISLRLKKPCPFLENNLCRIYPVRPLACILFPEYLVYENRVGEEARKELFRDFLCLHGTIPLSPPRAKIIRSLQKLLDRESLLSNYYLFNSGQCFLDCRNLPHELLLAAKTRQGTGATELPAGSDPISNQAMEYFLHKHFAGRPPFDGIQAKIDSLNSQEGQMQFLQLFQDDRLMQKLLHQWDDRDLIFKFVRGKLRWTRGSLVPSEVKFY